MHHWVFAALGVALVSFSSGLALGAAERVVDLGHPLSASDPSWDGEGFERTPVGSIEADGAAMGKFAADEHFGTHVDAPSHFVSGGWSVDQIPVDRLVRPAVCLNVETQVEKNEDYRLSLEDVKRFEAKQGLIPEGSLVLVATGWDRRWKAPHRYMNRRDGVLHFPGISVEAASYLAKVRKIVGIGIDTPSVDYGPSQHFETHRTTLPENLYHIENAARLTELPPKGFTVVVAPIYLAGGTGGPARVFALLP